MAQETRRGKRRRTWRRTAIEIAAMAGALGVGLFLRAHYYQTGYVPSSSMAPTLEPGDRYLLKKNAYTHGPPRRGDVIVFHHPTDKGQILVKRVVGLPGEQLGIVDGRVAVNGERLREDYLRTAPFVEGPRWLTVPDGTVYVLGDNRSLSEDSRDFGPVALRLIIGRATRIIWPLGRAGRIR